MDHGQRIRRIGGLQLSVAAVLACAVGSCGGPQPVTARDHEEAAAREEREALAHEESYDPNARATDGPQGLGPLVVYGTDVYNPTEQELVEAAEHRAHAEAHRRIADDLRTFAEAECARFPESTRAACPLLLDLTSVDDIEGGVRMSFAADAAIAPVVDHIRCHIAFAASRGIEGMESCALYVPGTAVNVDENVVFLTTVRPEHVAELRRRVREQAPIPM
jgi:hypothetical protein